MHHYIHTLISKKILLSVAYSVSCSVMYLLSQWYCCCYYTWGLGRGCRVSLPDPKVSHLIDFSNSDLLPSWSALSPTPSYCSAHCTYATHSLRTCSTCQYPHSLISNLRSLVNWTWWSNEVMCYLHLIHSKNESGHPHVSIHSSIDPNLHSILRAQHPLIYIWINTMIVTLYLYSLWYDSVALWHQLELCNKGTLWCFSGNTPYEALYFSYRFPLS